MYTATMRYQFTTGNFDEGVRIWKETVLEQAREAPGLIEMQLLTAEPHALAVGTWKEKSFAEAFMQTGIFKILTEKINPILASQPVPERWEREAWIRGKN
jgi:quinol monooxygenase YgiN